jgi:hypothetical protein
MTKFSWEVVKRAMWGICQSRNVKIFVCDRTITLRETLNSTKHPNKNRNYNEIFEMPLIFNLQTMSTVCPRCRSSLYRPDVIGCEQEVAEWVKKTRSVPGVKKKE